MNNRSNAPEEKEPGRKAAKKYLPIGYGGPNTGGRPGMPVDGRFGQESGFFDIIFEFLGIKNRPKKGSKGGEGTS